MKVLEAAFLTNTRFEDVAEGSETQRLKTMDGLQVFSAVLNAVIIIPAGLSLKKVFLVFCSLCPAHAGKVSERLVFMIGFTVTGAIRIGEERFLLHVSKRMKFIMSFLDARE